MHIALAGPIAGDDVRAYLHAGTGELPSGYGGAPLTGVLIGELLRLGHRVTGITTDPTLPLATGPVRREGPGFSFVVCPARPHAWRFNGAQPGRALDFFAAERRSIGLAMAQAAPDIVHAHWSYEFALAALDQTAPHLITCHDSPARVLRYTRSPYRAVRYLMARRVFRRGQEFSTVSDYMARELAPLLGHRPQVVPNPVAAQAFALGRTRSAPDARRAAMVCNGWDQLKNPETALRAFAMWRATEPAAELHLFGINFGIGEVAHHWVQANGLGAGMHFHGRQPHHGLLTALAGMNVLLHPSLEESFGVAVAEAMALGLPVVAGRDSGAVPWVLGFDPARGGGAGQLTDAQSAPALAHALQAVFDDEYGARSSAGRIRASALFSPLSVVAEYVRRYEAVLAGKHQLRRDIVETQTASVDS